MSGFNRKIFRRIAIGHMASVILLFCIGCSASSRPTNLNEYFQKNWMLNQKAIDIGIKTMLKESCAGSRATQECIEGIGFSACTTEQEVLKCSYSREVYINHDSRAQVEHRKETLRVGVRIKAKLGMKTEDVELLTERSGTNFIF